MLSQARFRAKSPGGSSNAVLNLSVLGDDDKEHIGGAGAEEGHLAGGLPGECRERFSRIEGAFSASTAGRGSSEKQFVELMETSTLPLYRDYLWSQVLHPLPPLLI